MQAITSQPLFLRAMPKFTKNVNFLGLGPGVTGASLGGIFFAFYFGSAFLTKKIIMQDNPDPERPKYFRDILVIKSAEEPEN